MAESRSRLPAAAAPLSTVSIAPHSPGRRASRSAEERIRRSAGQRAASRSSRSAAPSNRETASSPRTSSGIQTAKHCTQRSKPRPRRMSRCRSFRIRLFPVRKHSVRVSQCRSKSFSAMCLLQTRFQCVLCGRSRPFRGRCLPRRTGAAIASACGGDTPRRRGAEAPAFSS